MHRYAIDTLELVKRVGATWKKRNKFFVLYSFCVTILTPLFLLGRSRDEGPVSSADNTKTQGKGPSWGNTTLTLSESSNYQFTDTHRSPTQETLKGTEEGKERVVKCVGRSGTDGTFCWSVVGVLQRIPHTHKSHVPQRTVSRLESTPTSDYRSRLRISDL